MCTLLAAETAQCTLLTYCNASGLAEHITLYSYFRIDLGDYNFDYGCQGIQVHPEHVL
jgi:hypothetical protein